MINNTFFIIHYLQDLFLMVLSLYKLQEVIKMARGRKKALSLDQQLEEIVNEIAEQEQNLKDLKSKKKEIEKEIKSQKNEELLALIQKSGKSIDEVRSLIMG